MEKAPGTPREDRVKLLNGSEVARDRHMSPARAGYILDRHPSTILSMCRDGRIRGSFVEEGREGFIRRRWIPVAEVRRLFDAEVPA